MARIAYENVGSCVILVHGTHEPSAEEWEKYLEFLAQIRDRGGALRILVSSDGGAPTATQRNRLNSLFPAPYPVAVLSASTLVRGVVTALNWFYTMPLRTFAPGKIDDALRYLQVPPSHWSDIRERVQRLRVELGLVSAQVGSMSARP